MTHPPVSPHVTRNPRSSPEEGQRGQSRHQVIFNGSFPGKRDRGSNCTVDSGPRHCEEEEKEGRIEGAYNPKYGQSCALRDAPAGQMGP
ncbi:hypothetical protein VFPPC_00797 [Pochonia chlamydosporia 170]|uniref:Uncharacterized protein n=1 Tax=Pochonia chlamydosporia 170 TaxID=1380566 RepID=A0A179G544_METCM|nr:hypothetical protein VFPPC_00797 [Pochonia chlamydosporia 170]OAQ72966.1 hypothetical protein VFPPC_00797 [Pochonia chlamydosporia 170]